MNINASITKDNILDTALALWNEKGYSQTTLRELARRLGMSLDSLYTYFHSKEEIVIYLYRKLNEKAINEFHTISGSEKNLGKNVGTLVNVKLRILEPYRSCMIGIFKEAIDPESPLNPLNAESSQVLDNTVDLFRKLVEKGGVSKGEQALQLARILWIFHLGIILYWLHDRSEDSKNTRRIIEKLVNSFPFLRIFSKILRRSELMELVSNLFELSRSKSENSTSTQINILPRTFDIVVIGAGPIGLIYASWIKIKRPQTRLLVLERTSEAGHKIGESTLSGFCKALRSVGIRQDALRQLFYPKNGLGFFHINESTPDITAAPEYILEAFDETFQVERRTLDNLLMINARRLGVEIIQGADVHIERSSVSKNIITYSVGLQEFRVCTTLLVDASGPAGILSRNQQLYTKEGLTFQTGAVWTYFKDVRPINSYENWIRRSRFNRDQYTQHLCFREGWLWYIPIISWQRAPTGNLCHMLERVIDQENAIPKREDIEAAYGCPSTPITSIGLVLRSDRDSYLKEDVRGAFEHYSKKYPAIHKLLKDAKLLENYYGNNETFMSRLNIRGYARKVAGERWLLVGDAAFFVDPLISPGLTGGAAQAFFAAEKTVDAFNSGRVNSEAFSDYQTFVQRLHNALERDNQLVYMSFNHP